MKDFFTLDGIPLNDPSKRWVTEKGTSLRVIPARTALGASTPGRDGVRPSFGSAFDPGMIGINIAVLGDDYGSMLASVELLSGVLGQRHKLLPLVHHYGNGQERVAFVEVLASSEPELIAHRNAIITAQCSVPGTFWRDTASVDVVVGIPNGSLNPSPTLGGLAGTTGPISDALIQLRGNFSQVTLTDIVSGDSLTINQVVTSTQYLVIDTANWVARLHSTNSWDLVGGTNVIQNIVSNRGSGSMFTLNPDFAWGAGRVRMGVAGAINTATAPQVIVRAKRSFI